MVSLSKNQTVSLTKQSSALSQLQFGLGWDPIKKKGLLGGLFGGSGSIDLDAGCVLMDSAGNKIDTIWFRQLKSKCTAVVHSGDNLTGEGDGDDESLKIKLDTIPADVDKIVFVVTIHDAQARRQSFGQVSGAFIRLVNDDNQTEVARYDLTEDASTETAMLFGELYRHNTEWKFRAVGQGYAGGLSSVCAQYGINAS